MPERGSEADELLWRHVLARYGAFQSVVWQLPDEDGDESYASSRLALIARPSITVVRNERPCRCRASRKVSVVDTATSRIPPCAAVARTSRSAMSSFRLWAM